MSSLGGWLIALLLPLMLPAFEVNAQSIERVTWQKSGDIVTSATARNTGGRPWRVTFKVVVSGVLGKRYVGCTYLDADGNEIDVHAKSVGTFSRTAEFTVPSADAERIIFALWKDKVEDSTWSMGYYMRGRLDDTGWISLFDVWDSPLPNGDLY